MCDELLDDMSDIVGLLLLEGISICGLGGVVVVGEFGASTVGDCVFE